MTPNRDKISIALDDTPELSEYLSRKEVGDRISGTFEASLDENTGNLAILSIDEIKFHGMAPPTAEGESTAAVKLFKGKKSTEEDDEDEV